MGIRISLFDLLQIPLNSPKFRLSEILKNWGGANKYSLLAPRFFEQHGGQTHLNWGDNETDVLEKMDKFLESIGYLDFIKRK